MLGHVPRHFPTTDAPFLMSCYTDVFPGQEPPSTHSFPYKSCLIFCLLFVVLIPTVCFTAFTRQRSRPAQSPFDIRSMSRREMERRRREKRAWTGQVVGRVAEPGPQPHTYGPHGSAIFSMSTSTGGVGLLLVFLEISRVTASLWERKEDRRKREKIVCAAAMDGSSRIMIPRLISSSRGG